MGKNPGKHKTVSSLSLNNNVSRYLRLIGFNRSGFESQIHFFIIYIVLFYFTYRIKNAHIYHAKTELGKKIDPG